MISILKTTSEEHANTVAWWAERKYGSANVYTPQWQGEDGQYHYEVLIDIDDLELDSEGRVQQ